MNFKKLLFTLFLSLPLLISCSGSDSNHNDFDDSISLEKLLTSYDLWHIDLDEKTGISTVPFLQRAFTVSFDRGTLYANNNLVGIGSVGDGLGLPSGYYATDDPFLQIDHDLDGIFDFEVIQVSSTEIILEDLDSDASYYLVGYYTDEFDYDALFYDNIEYFLEEYEAWENTDTRGGVANSFDDENFLSFDNFDEFLSSLDAVGTPIPLLFWDFEGIHEIFDIINVDDEKILTLDYYDDVGNFLTTEEFGLIVVNDQQIELYHTDSGTTYEFTGRGNIVFTSLADKQATETGKMRYKVERKNKEKIKK